MYRYKFWTHLWLQCHKILYCCFNLYLNLGERYEAVIYLEKFFSISIRVLEMASLRQCPLDWLCRKLRNKWHSTKNQLNWKDVFYERECRPRHMVSAIHLPRGPKRALMLDSMYDHDGDYFHKKKDISEPSHGLVTRFRLTPLTLCMNSYKFSTGVKRWPRSVNEYVCFTLFWSLV